MGRPAVDMLHIHQLKRIGQCSHSFYLWLIIRTPRHEIIRIQKKFRNKTKEWHGLSYSSCSCLFASSRFYCYFFLSALRERSSKLLWGGSPREAFGPPEALDSPEWWSLCCMGRLPLLPPERSRLVRLCCWSLSSPEDESREPAATALFDMLSFLEDDARVLSPSRICVKDIKMFKHLCPETCKNYIFDFVC